jgi:hypothetical protein
MGGSGIKSYPALATLELSEYVNQQRLSPDSVEFVCSSIQRPVNSGERTCLDNIAHL